jgi:hypothetical protein
MFQSLSARLQDGIRFFLILLPAPPWAFLAVRLPIVPGANTGLPCSTDVMYEGVRLCLYTGGSCYQRESIMKGVHLPTYLLVQARYCQQLWLVRINDVYRQFTYINHTLLALAPLRLLLADSTSPHGSVYGYHSAGTFPATSHKAITPPACAGGLC